MPNWIIWEIIFGANLNDLWQQMSQGSSWITIISWGHEGEYIFDGGDYPR